VSKTAAKHKEESPKKLNFAVITCSTSRYHGLEKGEAIIDVSGDLITKLLEKSGHSVKLRTLIPDNEKMIVNAIKEAVSRNDVDSVITLGGTGITPSDVTIEAVQPLIEKGLPGFGELLRKISYEKIGSPAILTRAIAGIINRKTVFCLPGSPQAVEVAARNLILPEVGHIIKHAREG